MSSLKRPIFRLGLMLVNSHTFSSATGQNSAGYHFRVRSCLELAAKRFVPSVAAYARGRLAGRRTSRETRVIGRGPFSDDGGRD